MHYTHSGFIVVLGDCYSIQYLKYQPCQKTIRFAIVTIWIIFSRSYDAYCTYLLTPDLSKEANPLVSVLGLTWTPLLIVIGSLCLYVIYAYYISVFKPINLLPSQKGMNFREVSTYVYLGKVDSWLSMFYKYPKKLSRLNHVIGHALTICLVYLGVVSTIMWLLINHTKYYQNFHSVKLIYTIIVVGCFGLIFGWFKVMYRKYLMQEFEVSV